MAQRRLKKLLAKVEAILDASHCDLSKPLHESPGEVCSATAEASGEAFLLFGRAIPLQGQGDVSVRAHPPDTMVGILDLPDPGPLPPGELLVELKLGCEAAVNPTRRRYNGPRFELVPRGDTRVRYRHLRSLAATATGKEAVTELVQQARLPHSLNLRRNEPAVEVHQISGRMRFNLNLDFEVGWSDTVPGLEALLTALGDSAPLEFDLQISAGFGLAMVEEFELTVGRGPALSRNEGWVRASISRMRQRELTFGTQFALALTCNVNDPLGLILDRVFDHRGWRVVGAALATLDRQKPAFEAAAAGDWENLASLVGAESAEIVRRVLEGTQALESDHIVSIVRRIVEIAVFFEELAPEVQGLWEVVMEGASLDRSAPVFSALEQIAAIGEDPEGDTVAAFLGVLTGGPDPAVEAAIFLLELLTGIDLESIVIGGATVRDRLAQAARHAAAALAFLERLNELPLEVIEGMRSMLASTRAGAIISEILKVENAGDLAGLVGTGAGAIAQRLISSELKEATAEDLAQIQSWAGKLLRILERTDYQDRIRRRFNELNGELGFSLGLELELLTRRSRVLDLELEPTSPLACKVLSDLGKGDIGGVVNRLTAEQSNGFLLHDCLFTSRRARVTAVQILLSLLGWRSDTTRRVQEDWIRVDPDPPEARRRARFAGGVVRRIARAGKRSECATWLTHRVEGPGLDPGSPFEPEIDTELRLSLATREDETTILELRSIDDLLFDLGFIDAPVQYQAEASEGMTVSLTVSLRLGSAAVEGLLCDLDRRASWCVDARNALHRWFIDRSVNLGLPGRSNIRRGDAFAAFVRSSLYSRACSQSSLQFETEIANNILRMTLADRDGQPRAVRLRPVRQTGGAPTPHPAFAAPITAVQGLLKDARRHLYEFGEALKTLRAANEITANDLSRISAKFCKAIAAADNGHWPSPTLPLWVVVARLARTRPQALTDARGVATVRFRDAGASEWAVVERLQTTDGIPRHRVGDPEGIFPISAR